MADDTQAAAALDGWQERPSCGVVPLTLLEQPPDPSQWMCLADPSPAAGRTLEHLVEVVSATRDYTAARTKGSRMALFFSDVLLAVTLRQLDGQPVPLLRADTTWIHMDEEGHFTAVAHVGRPEVRHLGEQEVSRLLHELLDPTMETLHELTRVARPALWAQCWAALADVLLMVQQRPAHEVRAAMAAFTASDPVFRRAQPRFHQTELDGLTHTYATRRVCCFEYLPDKGYCGYICPLADAREQADSFRSEWREHRAGCADH